MAYSKIQQDRTFLIEINTKKIKCPICNRKGAYHRVDTEILCECGYVHQTPHQYVGGFRINTDSDYKLKIRRKVNKK